MKLHIYTQGNPHLHFSIFPIQTEKKKKKKNPKKTKKKEEEELRMRSYPDLCLRSKRSENSNHSINSKGPPHT